MLSFRDSFGVEPDAAAGVGGLAGMKKAGIEQTDAMMETYRTMELMSSGEDTHSGTISWPIAAPKGFASDTMAVAVTRPLGLNQRSE